MAIDKNWDIDCPIPSHESEPDYSHNGKPHLGDNETLGKDLCDFYVKHGCTDCCKWKSYYNNYNSHGQGCTEGYVNGRK